MTLRLDWYAHEVPAVVRRRPLRRHRAILDEERSTAFVLLAQGPPRAWGLSLDAAVHGLLETLDGGERSAEPLLAGAASRVRACAAALVDDSPVQIHGLAMTVRGERLHVATAGSVRAYLQRGTEHRRLTSSSDAKGLLKAFTFPTAKETLQAGDIVVVGPSHVFGPAGVGQLAKLLKNRDRASARSIARGLLSTADTEQTGGAVVALRAV
jgi:hypothetical protein